MEKISCIIKSGEYIVFYRELEATESDLKLRQKKLEIFLNSLSTPRGKTKKRKVPMEKYVRFNAEKLPLFRSGDVFAYEINGEYRILCFVSRGKFYSTYASYCYAWATLYEQVPLLEDLSEEYIIPLGYFTIETFPRMDKLNFIANYSEMKKLGNLPPRVLNEYWEPATWALAKEHNLSETYPLRLCLKCSDCLEKIKELKDATNN